MGEPGIPLRPPLPHLRIRRCPDPAGFREAYQSAGPLSLWHDPLQYSGICRFLADGKAVPRPLVGLLPYALPIKRPHLPAGRCGLRTFCHGAGSLDPSGRLPDDPADPGSLDLPLLRISCSRSHYRYSRHHRPHSGDEPQAPGDPKRPQRLLESFESSRFCSDRIRTLLQKRSSQESRFLRTFPRMHSIRYAEAFQKLREAAAKKLPSRKD